MSNDPMSDFNDAFGDEGSTMTMPADLGRLLAMVVPGGGGTPIIESESVRFHDDQAIVLPRGMTYERGLEVLERLHEESETYTSFSRTFRYRVNDGLYATAQVLKARYGVTVGANGFFKHAVIKEIPISLTETVQVAAGDIEIPALKDAEVHLGGTHDNDYGTVFWIHVDAKKRLEGEVKALFDAIEQYLNENSIYRGQAIFGANDPEFMDLTAVDPSKIVFSNDVTHALENGVWSYLRYSEAFREEGVSLKRTALLFGPYGTGKTSAGVLTGLEAVANGWTFISADPANDNILDVMRTARLYQPAVVFIEDIDTDTSSGEDDEVSPLLDAFDGITAKGGELMVVMTTNHINRIHKGMLRPGRLDMTIEVSALDSDGVEKLIKANIPSSKLADDLDFEKIGIAMEEFHPAFVTEAIGRARQFAMAQSGGSRNYKLSTDDFVVAGTSLRPQFEILNEAGEGERKPTLDAAFGDSVHAAAQRSVHGVHVHIPGSHGELHVPELNGVSH